MKGRPLLQKQPKSRGSLKPVWRPFRRDWHELRNEFHKYMGRIFIKEAESNLTKYGQGSKEWRRAPENLQKKKLDKTMEEEGTAVWL